MRASTLCHFPRVCGRVQNKLLDVGWRSRGRCGRPALRGDAVVPAAQTGRRTGFDRAPGPAPPAAASRGRAHPPRDRGASPGLQPARRGPGLDPQRRRDTPRFQTGKLRHGETGLSGYAVYLALSTLVTRSPCNATHGPRCLSSGALHGLHLALDLLRPVPGPRQVDGSCCRMNE